MISCMQYVICGPVVQLVRMPACHAGGHGFEPRSVRHIAHCIPIEWLAQLVEHQPYKLGVTGSNPVPPTMLQAECGPVVQMVRMPACHAGGRGFEPRPVRHLLRCKQQV